MLHRELDNYLTPQEVSELLRVRTNTLKQWRSARKGPAFVKFGYGRGAMIRYPERELLNWIEAQRASTVRVG